MTSLLSTAYLSTSELTFPLFSPSNFVSSALSDNMEPQSVHLLLGQVFSLSPLRKSVSKTNMLDIYLRKIY
jgi:hypothetical protein